MPTISVKGTTVTVRWSPAADNVGVVGYDVLRDDKVKGTMTAAVRVFTDLNVPPGVAHLDRAGPSTMPGSRPSPRR